MLNERDQRIFEAIRTNRLPIWARAFLGLWGIALLAGALFNLVDMLSQHWGTEVLKAYFSGAIFLVVFPLAGMQLIGAAFRRPKKSPEPDGESVD
jgi:hypothetical protein